MILFKKLFILVLVFCLVFLIGCGGSGSSNTNWDTYQVFSTNLIQPTTNNNENNAENNNNEETNLINLNQEQYKNYTICFTDNPSEISGAFQETNFITYNSEELKYFFGKHMIFNSVSSKNYLCQHLKINNLNEATNRTYKIIAEGYIGDNNILYLKISEANEI